MTIIYQPLIERHTPRIISHTHDIGQGKLTTSLKAPGRPLH
jgi:hypothetical protein